MHWPAVGDGSGEGEGLLGILGAEKGEKGHTSLSPASTLCASVSLSLSSRALLKSTLQAGTIPVLSLSRGNPPAQVMHRASGTLRAILLPFLTRSSLPSHVMSVGFDCCQRL